MPPCHHPLLLLKMGLLERLKRQPSVSSPPSNIVPSYIADDKAVNSVESAEPRSADSTNKQEGAHSVLPLNDGYNSYTGSGLKRALGPRQLTFISIGAAIGTGVFLGTGTALANGGPLGLLLGYLVMASVVVSVCFCVGEMVTLLPVMGGHLTLAGRFVDPAFSAAASWNYWICWCLVLCAELSASATLVDYWNPGVNPGVWIAVFLVFTLSFNILGANIYGEAEFWFSSLKIITITGLVILSIVITAGGAGNNPIGFRFWRNPGPFVQYKGINGSSGRFLGFFSVMTQAAFSQIGSEMLALAAAETRNPRRALPTALNSVWIRIAFFYLTSVFVIGLIVPSNDPTLGSSSDASASPFVIAIQHAGIKALPSVVNAAVLTSALSAGCADLFTTSRALHSMASKGQAPAFFTRTLKNGNPYAAVLMSWAMGLLAFLSINNGSAKAFEFFVNLTSISGVLTWWIISVTYLRFWRGLQVQGLKRREFLPWTTPFTPFMAVWALLFITAVMLFTGWTSVRPGNFEASGCECRRINDGRTLPFRLCVPTRYAHMNTNPFFCALLSASVFSTYTPLGWFALFYAGCVVCRRERAVVERCEEGGMVMQRSLTRTL